MEVHAFIAVMYCLLLQCMVYDANINEKKIFFLNINSYEMPASNELININLLKCKFEFYLSNYI